MSGPLVRSATSAPQSRHPVIIRKMPTDIVLVNASAALVAAAKARDFREGVAMAAASIDSGTALAKAQELARFTQQFV